MTISFCVCQLTCIIFTCKYLCVTCPKLANRLSTIHAAVESNVNFNEVPFVQGLHGSWYIIDDSADVGFWSAIVSQFPNSCTGLPPRGAILKLDEVNTKHCPCDGHVGIWLDCTSHLTFTSSVGPSIVMWNELDRLRLYSNGSAWISTVTGHQSRLWSGTKWAQICEAPEIPGHGF